MTNMELIAALLEESKAGPYGDSCSFKLGYVMQLLAEIADANKDVSAELADRLNYLKGKK